MENQSLRILGTPIIKAVTVPDAKIKLSFICDKKRCGERCPSDIDGFDLCKHTSDFTHALNYSSPSEINLETDFDRIDTSKAVAFFEKEERR